MAKGIAGGIFNFGKKGYWANALNKKGYTKGKNDSSSPDFNAAFPEFPDLKVDDADLYLGQVDDLIKQYTDITTGKSMFDAVKYMYEPQKQVIDAEYGIGGPSGDVFSAKTGALADLQAGLNRRGLLDAGTSGLLESQLYANRARDLANLMGEAKTTQRNEYFGALEKLQGLYPDRFDVRNIQNSVDYFNAVNEFNQTDAPRASAQAGFDNYPEQNGIIDQVAQLVGLFGGPKGRLVSGAYSLAKGAGGSGGGGNRGGVSPNYFNQTYGGNSGYSSSGMNFGTQGGNPNSSTGYNPQFRLSNNQSYQNQSNVLGNSGNNYSNLLNSLFGRGN